jgi:O-antigen/teichoic acid export membrane protein
LEDKYGKESVVKNISWKLFERGASVAVTFAVTIALARILDPQDFGLAAMVTVFVTISTIFVTSGLGNSLIQKKDADELDFSSVFWLNLGVSVVLYLIIFAISPLIAKFYGYSQLSSILRVLSLRLLVSAINSIQCAYISRNMMFRYYFFSTLTGKIGSGIIGIIMALMGYGVWALIGQSLSVIVFETCALWVKVKWRPKKIFSLERARDLYSFAWKIMLMSFVEVISNQLRNLFIGKKYSSEDLAFYDKGALFPNNIITNIASSLSAVMFPVLANTQDDIGQALSICRRWLGIFAYCAYPILIGMVIVAEQFITILLTEKWLSSVPFLQLACGIYAVWIIEVPIRETIKSIGYADICLKMQIIKTVFTLVVLLVVMDYGVMAIAVSALVSGIFNIIVSAYYGNKFVGYRPMLLFKDIAPTLVINLLMGGCVYLISLIELQIVFSLVLQIITGVLTYIVASVISKNENFSYCVQLARSIFRRKKQDI